MDDRLIERGFDGAVAVNAPLALVDDMLAVCTTVELWRDRVVIHLVGLPGDQARARLAAWRAERDEHPGLAVLDLPLRVTDDQGRELRATGRHGHASGPEYRCRLDFEPGRSAGARSLAITVDGSAPERAAVVTVPLP